MRGTFRSSIVVFALVAAQAAASGGVTTSSGGATYQPVKQQDLVKNSQKSQAANGQVHSFTLWNSKSAAFAPDSFVKVHATSLGLGQQDALVNVNTHNAKHGVSQLRLQQHHRNVLVDGAQYSLLTVNGFVVAGQGQLVKGLNVAATPTVAEAAALQAAMANLARPWEWVAHPEHPAPKGTLAIWSPDFGKTTPFVLTWRFDLPTTGPELLRTYVDAKTGAVLGSVNQAKHADVPASGTTMVNRPVTFTTDEFQATAPKYRLKETGHRAIHVFTQTSPTDRYQVVEVTDVDNIWNELAVRLQVNAYYSAEAYWDFLAAHGRDGFDGKGTAGPGVEINVITSGDCSGSGPVSVPYTSAGWPDHTYLCAFEPGLPPAADAETLGHELTHHVLNHSMHGDFGTSVEAQSLGEAIPDMMAMMIAGIVDGRVDWAFLESDPNHTRSFSNPRAFGGSPATYQGPGWNLTDTDGHIGATVIDHWFYLLAMGGKGTNDVGKDYDVSPIGQQAATDLVWLTVPQFTTNMSFHDFRTITTVAAQFNPIGVDLQTNVKAAWDAVNVLDPTNPVVHFPRDGQVAIQPWDFIPTFAHPLVSGAKEAGYRVEVSDLPDFSAHVTSDEVDGTDSVHQIWLDPMTVYYWRVKPKKPDGSWGDWAFTSSFETSRVQPRNVTPRNARIDVGPWPLHFGWDPVKGADEYEVQIADDQGFTKNLQKDTTTATTMHSLYGTPDHEHYWRVRARRGNHYGDWSTRFQSDGLPAADQSAVERAWFPDDALHFKTGTEAPDAVEPKEGDTVYPWALVFKWSDIHAEKYEVEVQPLSTTPPAGSPEVPWPVSVKVTGAQETPKQNLQLATPYQWRVQGFRKGISGGWSKWFKFKTNDAKVQNVKVGTCSWPLKVEWDNVPGATEAVIKWQLNSDPVETFGTGLAQPPAKITVKDSRDEYQAWVNVYRIDNNPKFKNHTFTGASSDAKHFKVNPCNQPSDLKPDGNAVPVDYKYLRWKPANNGDGNIVELKLHDTVVLKTTVWYPAETKVALPKLKYGGHYAFTVTPTDSLGHKGPPAKQTFETPQKTRPCGQPVTASGGDEGGDWFVDLGSPGFFDYTFDFVNIQDELQIFSGSTQIATTGCTNKTPADLVNSHLITHVKSPTQTIRLVLTPDCAGDVETKWSVTVKCSGH
ncbi:MAG: M4 family metallopeptidase [Myxococcaceae bacterium]